MAHFFTAKLLKIKVESVVIGGNKVIFQKSFKNTRFNFYMNPFKGGSVYINKEQVIINIKKIPLILISAPFLNLIIGLIFCWSDYNIFRFVSVLNLCMFFVSLTGSDGRDAWKIRTHGIAAIPEE